MNGTELKETNKRMNFTVWNVHSPLAVSPNACELAWRILFGFSRSYSAPWRRMTTWFRMWENSASRNAVAAVTFREPAPYTQYSYMVNIFWGLNWHSDNRLSEHMMFCPKKIYSYLAKNKILFVAPPATGPLKMPRPKIFYCCFQNNILIYLFQEQLKN